MDINITLSSLNESVKEEISRIASGSYSADGAPLYDSIRITSRDTGVMGRLLKESLVVVKSAIVRFLSSDIDDDATDAVTISLNLSTRRENGKQAVIPELIESSLAKLLLSKYFSEKNQTEMAAKFDGLAAADLQTLQKVLYSKQSPY